MTSRNMFEWKFRLLIPLACILALARSEVSRYEADGFTMTLLNPSEKMNARSGIAEPYVVKGDMLFTEETWAIWNSPARGIIQGDMYRWPKDSSGNVIVPYQIDAAWTGSKTNLLAGFDQWSSKTCIKFIEKSDPSLPAGTGTNWIAISPGGGCSSYVGMINRGAQAVTLGTNCDVPPIVAHEVGHALGFGHENQRSDRDDWLVSFPDNVQAGMGYNFDKDTFDNHGVPYDYSSVMHYFWNAFAIDGNKPTIMPKDPSLRYLLEANNPVDHYDALSANLAFGCIDTWKTKCGASAPTCLNFGYLGPSCTCVCPSGTSGADCGTVTAPSLPYYPPPACGGKITTSGAYAVPGMGGARAAGLKCTWYIEAPVCTNATVTITNFNTYVDVDCYFERLFVGASNLYVPDVGPLCGGVDKVPDGTKYTGSPSIVLYYRSNVNYGGGAGGFKFQVDFVPQNGCTPPTPTAAPVTTAPPPPPSTTAPPPPPTTTPPPPPPTTTPPPPPPTTTPPPPPPTTTTRPPPPPTTTKPATQPTTTRPGQVTTPAPAPTGCLLTKLNATAFSWTSPGFPGKAPANSRCSVIGNTSGTSFTITFKSFAVTSDTTCTKAYVLVAPTFPIKVFCNNKSGTKLTINKKFIFMQYQSDPAVATTGFNITIASP